MILFSHLRARACSGWFISCDWDCNKLLRRILLWPATFERMLSRLTCLVIGWCVYLWGSRDTLRRLSWAVWFAMLCYPMPTWTSLEFVFTFLWLLTRIDRPICAVVQALFLMVTYNTSGVSSTVDWLILNFESCVISRARVVYFSCTYCEPFTTVKKRINCNFKKFPAPERITVGSHRSGCCGTWATHPLTQTT